VLYGLEPYRCSLCAPQISQAKGIGTNQYLNARDLLEKVRVQSIVLVQGQDVPPSGLKQFPTRG